jgi:general secretion pathway protein M
MDTLSARQRKGLAAAILVLVVVMLLGLTALPIWSANRGYQNAIETAQQRLERLRRTADSGSDLQSRFDQLQRSRVAAAHTLQSATPALAGAELQRIVTRSVAASGGQVLSTQIMPVREEQQFLRVAVKVRMRGTLEHIMDLFYALESGEPFLFLDQVSIRRLYARTRGRPDAGPGVETDFELAGYMAQS